MDSSTILQCTLCIVSLIESTAFKLPYRINSTDQVLNQNNSVDGRSIAMYGFAIIRNTTVPCENTDKKKFRFHTMSDNDKQAIFGRAGGAYNKEYMATDLEEAGENFINLLGVDFKPHGRGSSNGEQMGLWRKFKTKRDVLNLVRSNAEFNQEYPKGNPDQARDKHNKGQNTKGKDTKKKYVGEHHAQTSDEQAIVGSNSYMPYLLPSEMGLDTLHIDEETGDKMSYEYCRNRGQRTDDGYYLHMCTTCACSTSLGEKYWPPIINEAVRLDDDPYCFIDEGKHHGKCLQRTLPMNMLQRRQGYCSLALKDGEIVIVDDWVQYTRMMRIGTECVMNAFSDFAQYVGKYN